MCSHRKAKTTSARNRVQCGPNRRLICIKDWIAVTISTLKREERQSRSNKSIIKYALPSTIYSTFNWKYFQVLVLWKFLIVH